MRAVTPRFDERIRQNAPYGFTRPSAWKRVVALSAGVAIAVSSSLLVTPAVSASAAVAAASIAQAQAQGISVASLSTNGRVNPLGIGGADPAFGWQTTSDLRGSQQAAYQVQVGSTAGAADVWDSGKVDSAQQVNINYGGPDLAAGTRYYWQVRIWDTKGGQSAWSAPAWYETGLLSAADWGSAAWVGKTAPSYDNWNDYTAALDFQLNSTAFGTFLRAKDTNNAYMWQLQVGDNASDIPKLRPHVRVNGTYSLLGEIDLRPFGFTRAALLSGTHKLSFTVSGSTITTSLDGKQVDTRTASTFAAGQVGIRTFGGESVTISGLSVAKPDGTVLAQPDFSRNPFTSGTFSGRKVTISGSADALISDGNSNEPLLRTSFTTTPGKTVASARAYASGHGVYELSLNGSKVGDQFLAPGYTEYAKRIQSQTYDVTDLVRAGANGFGAALGDGWWAGKIGLDGKGQYGTNVSLVARLKITYTDGTVQWVDSSPEWKWAPGPFVATDNQIGETYDATFEKAGWNTAGYDDTAWSPVAVGASDTAKLTPQNDEPVRQWNTLTATKLTQPAPGVNVYDLGQNMVGIPRVTITGKAGQTVKLRHAEVLNPDGTLYTANLRAALATDYYTFAADGTVTYQPTFTQHGFRYIEITGVDQAPAIADVKGVVIGSDLKDTGTLQTSNSMLNQLHSNVYWGARGNFLSIPTDTPARDERLGWTGDISIFAPTASYLSDMRGFLAKWMGDVRDEQYANGGVPAVVPSTNGMFGMQAIGWEDAIITVPHAAWNAYGDTQIVQDNYDAMKKFMDYARASAGSDNLETGRLSFFTNDWLNLDDPSDQGVLGTAIWAQDVKMMAEMAGSIGRTADAAEYAALYQSIRKSFTDAYVAADGTVRGNSQTGYALALGMDLITDPARQRNAGLKYVAKLAQANNHLRTGFIGTPWLLPALSNIGRDDLGYRILLQQDYPSWGYEISKGATTVWERWNSIQPDGSFGPVDMNSFNHYAYGAVADWMHQSIAGIRIAEPGYKKSIIAPRIGGGLTSGDGSIDTVYGKLANSWKLTDGAVTMNVTVPANTTAEVHVPSGYAGAVTESGKPLTGTDGVQKVTYDNDASQTVITVGSGTYSFAVPAISTPPTEPTSDYVDFGDAASEQAHAVTGSPSSGTNSEAGLTRRYANNQFPGAFYSAQVKVPANQPFLLRARETWNTPGAKDYDVYVNDVLVKHVRSVRYEGGQGSSNYEFLVDNPAVLANNGTVTVKYVYPASNPAFTFYDPSIADLWVIPQGPVDTTAPTVDASVSGRTVTLTGTDDGSGLAGIEYKLDGGGWTAYGDPIVVDNSAHTVTYRGTDKAGNVSTEKTVQLPAVDETAPVVTVTSNPAQATGTNGWFTSSVTVTASATDDSGVAPTLQVSRDGGATWDNYTPQTVTEGVAALRFRAADAAGNISEPVAADVRVDSVAPLTTSTVDAKARTVTVNATDHSPGSDVAFTEARVNGGAWTKTDGATAVTTVGAGAATVEYRATDAAGNVSATGTVAVPAATNPNGQAKVTITSADQPSADGWYTQNVVVSLTAPTGTTAQYRLNGGTWRAASSAITVSTNGANTIDHRLLKSNVVVEGSLGTLPVKIDKTLPSASVVAVPSTAAGTPRNPVTLSFAGADALSGVARVEYKVNQDQWTAFDPTKPASFSTVGAYLISYRSLDEAGNTSATKTITVKITADPATTLRASSSTVTRDAFVTFALAGYKRYDTITIKTGDQEWTTVFTDVNGAARVTTKVPANLQVGRTTVTAAGSDGQQTSTITLTVK